MNKTDLIKEVAKQSSLSQKDCLFVLNAFTKTITKTLKEGDNVSLLGFGKFEVRNRKARNSINPKTLEPLVIPAGRVPVFRVSKTFKQAIK
jgi:DNA-binding protein HU-beta